MKFNYRLSPKVLAHRIGDPIPDWVMDLVTARQLILRKPENPQSDTDVIFELPNLVTSDVIDVPMKGIVGDYFVFDGLEYKIVPGNEFVMLYDVIDPNTSRDSEPLGDNTTEGMASEEKDDTPVMMGVGVITKEEMGKKLDEECKGAILIGDQRNRTLFFPAIIGIDHAKGRVIYDRDAIVQQLYRHGGMTMEEADEHVSYNIERSLEYMTNDTNKDHMPLIVERQECF
jgi:hypothetical protein